MLKYKIDKLEDVAEAYRGEYQQGTDSKFYLKLEGIDVNAESKVKEFRDNNIKLAREKDELLKKYEGIDPEEFKKIMDEQRQLKEKQMLEAGDVEKLLAERTERLRKDYDSKIESISKAHDAIKKEAEGLHIRLSEVLIDSEITKAVSKVGQLNKGAMDIFLDLGKKVWRLEDGHPIAKRDDKIIYGTNPQKPIDFDEWALSVVQDYPYLIAGAKGMESLGGDRGSLNMTADEWMKQPIEKRLEQASKDLMTKK